MRIVLQAACVAALGLVTLPASAQSGDASRGADTQAAGETGQENLVLPPDAAPKPMSPAETETPQKPAASGGEASDATQSGAPLGAAPNEAMSGSDDTDANSSEVREQPRNAVGDKFEMPHLTKENQVAIITDLCGIQIRNMTPAACSCLADQAVEKLTPAQRDYLIASVVAPPTADQLVKKGTVTKEDQKVIFTFVDSTSETCKTTGPTTAPQGGTSN
ncbi:hypothetical protein [Jiella mangrovi]|uniref:Secreted protein n=1 Tax=Jiella mangrovi TaxID=2821407 RepID=A0ABS4BNC8_9HYPH|nr:hypothetical protein [Jiella mangrovi]MBP0618248.1 hypothetical protein [Jiella mangrovi]